MKVGSTAIRGHQTYARAAATEQLEAAATAAKAVRNTRSIGFSLGKFGVRYETEEGLNREQMMQQAAQETRSQTANTSPPPSLNTTGLQKQTALSMFSQQLDLTNTWQRRQGANAYTKSNNAYQTEQQRPMLSGRV